MQSGRLCKEKRFGIKGLLKQTHKESTLLSKQEGLNDGVATLGQQLSGRPGRRLGMQITRRAQNSGENTMARVSIFKKEAHL